MKTKLMSLLSAALLASACASAQPAAVPAPAAPAVTPQFVYQAVLRVDEMAERFAKAADGARRSASLFPESREQLLAAAEAYDRCAADARAVREAIVTGLAALPPASAPRPARVRDPRER